MRITLVAMLLLGSSAIKLHHKAEKVHVPAFLQLFKGKGGPKRHEDCPPPDVEKEIEEAIEAELAKEGHSITKEEAAAGIQEYADAHGHELSEKDWEELEAAFDEVDTSGNGELEADELAAVEAEYRKWCPKVE